ncbi:unnamed protein product [Linum tenue]|uniref:Uncharacterized protein n=1 Tax=Linum tenue TaxID=586396 RepID=A0AAV0J0S2_9ROSI|nr:unnamed protein product [Linum tenue]
MSLIMQKRNMAFLILL